MHDAVEGREAGTPTSTPAPSAAWLSPRRLGLAALLLALYLVSTVPVGLALYSLKSAEGVDLFKNGGFHTYLRCLKASTLSATGAKPSSQAP